VLIYDENVDIRRTLAESLEEVGIKVWRARSSMEVLRRVRQEDIQVVSLDCASGRMDSIETAQRIQQIKPEVRIIFLSAQDPADYRQRAAAAGVRLECWIDKTRNGLDHAKRAILEALGRNFAIEVSKRLEEAAQAARVTLEQWAVIERYLAPYSWAIPLGLAPRPEPEPVAPEEPTPRTWEEVLRELAYYLEEAWPGYSDPAHRQFAWDRFREVTFDHLWAAVEPFPQDEYRQQLAVQLERAVRKVEAPFLTLPHLDAARLSLERLRSEKVGQHDVSACKKAWRKAGVETLPSFRQVLSGLVSWRVMVN
jgi:CheY-like chemotaxis protein